jgi:two-component system sensor histidine kinase CreC
MKLQVRILVSLLLVIGTLFYFFIDFINNEVGYRYVESVEESLNDTAHLLASMLEQDVRKGVISTSSMQILFDEAGKRRFSAKIYEWTKTGIDLEAYVVDRNGVILFNSQDPTMRGMDYSQWNDVYLTLKGRYGARLSRTEDNREFLYVGAPITWQGSIIGAVTVVKPKDKIDILKSKTKRMIITALIISVTLFILLSFLYSFWITHPIMLLRRYVHSIDQSKNEPLPRLGNTEIRDLGMAFKEMVLQLQGKAYIEQYIQSMTHEIKSPLSSIRGAAELLTEEMPMEQRQKFYENIKTESIRIETIISRLLQLSSLENRRELQNVENFELNSVVEDVISSQEPQARKNSLSVNFKADKKAITRGERFLIRHALANLLENATRFSPPGSTIEIELVTLGNSVAVNIRDHGPGIPDYATGRIFERFYSLPHQENGSKSSGLGLSLVREATTLHGGSLSVSNHPEGGVLATITLPLHEQ